MFYVRYVRAELLRRKGRTILTLLGLALGVGLVIAISSLSKGLDDAQKATLDPLAGIGTDLTVTRKAQDDQGGGFAGPGGGGGQRDVVEANNAAITDLSKLGKPGTHFVHDFFLPGTQLTFAQSQAKDISSVDGVAAVSSGLMLQAVHQEGTVPKIVSKIQTGGQQFDIRRRITPPTEAEQQQIQKCIAKLQEQSGGSNDQQQGLGNGNDRNNRPGGGFFFRGDRGAFAKCLPKRMQQFRTTFTTPRETLQQVLDPPQTNIKSASYTIAGVQTTTPDMGLVTAAQVTKGRYFDGASQALVSETYAKRNKLKIGSAISNARAFLDVQRECDSFDRYVWAFVGGAPMQRRRRSMRDVPARSRESDALSADLKRRGFRFVGSTIVYAFMQASGLVNDHLIGCFRRVQVQRLDAPSRR